MLTLLSIIIMAWQIKIIRIEHLTISQTINNHLKVQDQILLLQINDS